MRPAGSAGRRGACLHPACGRFIRAEEWNEQGADAPCSVFAPASLRGLSAWPSDMPGRLPGSGRPAGGCRAAPAQMSM